jgi:hypothetical protein
MTVRGFCLSRKLALSSTVSFLRETQVLTKGITVLCKELNLPQDKRLLTGSSSTPAGHMLLMRYTESCSQNSGSKAAGEGGKGSVPHRAQESETLGRGH